MDMIYGLNYLGSSLMGPTWACAPGMQTGSLQGHLCPWGREEEGWGAAWQAPASPMGDSRERGQHCLPVRTRYRLGLECPPGALCLEEWKEEWVWSLNALGANSD